MRVKFQKHTYSTFREPPGRRLWKCAGMVVASCCDNHEGAVFSCFQNGGMKIFDTLPALSLCVLPLDLALRGFCHDRCFCFVAIKAEAFCVVLAVLKIPPRKIQKTCSPPGESAKNEPVKRNVPWESPPRTCRGRALNVPWWT